MTTCTLNGRVYAYKRMGFADWKVSISGSSTVLVKLQSVYSYIHDLIALANR